MYRTILVPTDVDESYGMTPAPGSFELALEAWEERGQSALDAVVAAGVTVETHCLRGSPYESILSFAADHDVDLTVMGRRGAGGVARLHIGSVTDRVIRLSEVPVLPV
ncbi:universal stress protein [Halomarina litorea]|uniref:universal stress protein n=1 Tax=Halomarina litorea TaxID=2961595 RepID=UPI0020C2301A|nr:universal stress protein [Halomarina sp. BCD28]